MSLQDITSSGIIDQEDVVEHTRLYNKPLLVAQTLGGMLPGVSPLVLLDVQNVLELACGPGGWLLRMARDYPHIQFTGVDTSPTMIDYALARAHKQTLPNVSCQKVPHLQGPFAFADASFDLISAQWISKFLAPSAWPKVLTECVRLLRPGGYFRLTEFDMGEANSPAHEELAALFIRAMRKAGRSFGITDRHLGLLPELEPLVSDAGFQDVRLLSHTVNYSYGAPFHEEWTRDFQVLSRLAQPLIVDMGVASCETLNELQQRQQVEMALPNFHAILPLLTIWGTRP